MSQRHGPPHDNLVCRLLSGSWRHSPLPLTDFSEAELDEVVPLLYGSGAGALGWWRLRRSDLRSTPSATVLRQAYRLQCLQSAIHEEKIQKIFQLLGAAGIEPILIKGWAAARYYPQQGLRPYGDLDLIVQPRDLARARQIVDSPEARDCWVDLHHEVSELADRSLDQLFKRSRTVSLGAETIRLLSAEDHLALLAVHLLKHGAWRPLWLCDIGAAIELATAEFDWDLCLGRDRRRAGWIVSAIGLAHQLLGANLKGSAIADRQLKLPGWLVPAVLKQWEHPFATNQPPTKHPVPILSQLKQPRGLWRGLLDRWPDPILATVSVHGGFNGLPRFPYQLANCVVRFGQFLSRLPQSEQRA